MQVTHGFCSGPAVFHEIAAPPEPGQLIPQKLFASWKETNV
jgi:hypothetical protein